MTLNKLLNLIRSFIGIHILNIAIDLQFFEMINKNRLSLSQLIEKINLKQNHFESYVELLINIGLTKEDQQGQLQISPLAKKYLLKESKDSIIPYIKWKIVTTKLWNKSIDVLKGNINTIYGENLYSYLQSRPRDYHLFHNALERVEKPIISKIPQLISPFIPKNQQLTMLDIGCGSALPSILLMQRFKNISACLIDLYINTAIENTSRHGLSDRVKIQKKNFFIDPLPKADMVLLSFTISDWSDKEIRNLLKKVKRSLNENGMLFIVDYISDKKNNNFESSLLNFLLSIETNGSVRTFDKWLNLLNDFFCNIKKIPIFGSAFIILAEKKGGIVE